MRRHPFFLFLTALALAGFLVTGCINTASTSATPPNGAANAGSTTPPAQVADLTASPSPSATPETVTGTSAPSDTSAPATSTNPTETTPGATSNPSGSGAIDPFQPVVQIVKNVEPSIVTVITENGLGSGIIYNSDGMIVTNNHVVASGSTYKVAFASGEQVPATLVGTDPTSDVAVLKVNKTGLPAASFETDLPQVGQLAVAMGSPLGLQDTVTVGIVSGLQRSIPASGSEAQALVDLIQTDAAISPGNSGGGLVDANSKVMGMNVAYIPPTDQAVSIGFAIPAATVTSVADDIIAGKTPQHPYLGIQFTQLTPDIAQQYGINADHGLIVLDVQSGSPADQAGMQPGDVILSVDGTPMNQEDDLLTALHGHAPGDTISIVISRNNQQQTLQVTLGNQP